MRKTDVHSVCYKQSRIAHSTLWNVFFVYTCDSPKIIYYKAIFAFFLVFSHSLYPFAFRRTEKLCHILNRQSHTEWMEIMALLNTTFTSIEILFIQRHRHFDMAFVVIPKKTQRTHLNVKFATKKNREWDEFKAKTRFKYKEYRQSIMKCLQKFILKRNIRMRLPVHMYCSYFYIYAISDWVILI